MRRPARSALAPSWAPPRSRWWQASWGSPLRLRSAPWKGARAPSPGSLAEPNLERLRRARRLPAGGCRAHSLIFRADECTESEGEDRSGKGERGRRGAERRDRRAAHPLSCRGRRTATGAAARCRGQLPRLAVGYSRLGSHSPRLRPRPARLPRQRQTRRRLLARLLRAVRSRFSRCFGHRESDVRGQLARRPHSPPPGALRVGSRNSPDPRRQRRPRVRGQSRVHLRQHPPPRRGGDALLEDPVRRLPEGVGADGVALHTSPQKRPARVVGRAVQAGPIARLPGGPPDRTARPGGSLRSTRGDGGPSTLSEDPDARGLGGTRPGVPALSGQAVGSPPPGRFARPHSRLRPHAPRRVPRPLLESPRRVPPQAGAPLIGEDPKKAPGYVGNVQEQGSRGYPYASAGQKPSLAARR